MYLSPDLFFRQICDVRFLCVCLLFLFWSLRLIFFAIRAWPRLIIIPTISLEQHQQMTVGMLGTEYFLYKVDGAKLPLVSMLGRDKRCRKVGRDFQIPGTLRWIMKFLCEDTCTHTLTHAHRLYELWGGWGVCVLCMMWDTDVFSYGFFFPRLSSPHPNPQILLTPPQISMWVSKWTVIGSNPWVTPCKQSLLGSSLIQDKAADNENRKERHLT